MDLQNWINENLILSSGKINVMRAVRGWLEKHHPDTKQQIIDATNFLNDDASITERIFCIRNNITKPKLCEYCNVRPVKFMNGVYNRYCGYECSTKVTANNTLVKQKRECTLIEKYGASNPMFVSEIVQKNVDKIKNRRPSKEILIDLHHNQKLPISKIAEIVGYAMQPLSNIMKEMNIEIQHNRSKRISKPPFRELEINYYDKRMTIKDMALHYGVSYETIYSWIDGFKRVNNFVPKKKHDIPPKESLYELHYEQKKPYTEIAKMYGVNDTIVGNWFKKYNLKNQTSKSRQSSEEREVRDFIRSFGFKTDKKMFPYHAFEREREIDIIVEGTNLAIEYGGIFHHSEAVGRDSTYHRDKMRMAETHGFNLLTIFDYEWNERRDIVKSIIKSKLGLNEKIYAKYCKVVDVCAKDARQFLNENHLNGDTNFIENAFGLTFNNELVACITFGKHHRNKNNTKLVLNRLCFKKDINIVGGASKLFKYAISKLPDSDIITWSDNRWSQGEIYQTLGFELDSVMQPGYFYEKGGKRYPASELMKSKIGCPKDMKEHEYAKTLGYNRVWDCGKKRWIFKNK